jgi:hypothetical protein
LQHPVDARPTDTEYDEAVKPEPFQVWTPKVHDDSVERRKEPLPDEAAWTKARERGRRAVWPDARGGAQEVIPMTMNSIAFVAFITVAMIAGAAEAGKHRGIKTTNEIVNYRAGGNPISIRRPPGSKVDRILPLRRGVVGGLIDAAAALEHLTGEPVVKSLGLVHRYNKSVFLAPPWPEIYVKDKERRHGLAEAVAEYDRLTKVYPLLGYDIHMLPKVSVAERADWTLASLTN